MLLAVKFSEFIVKVNVVIGIIVCAVGVASFLVASNITRAVEKTETVSKSSKVYMACKIVGLVCVLVGMILIALP